jgi:outer membrane receptor protein involved in Fe transport
MDRYNESVENIFYEKTILFAQGGGSYGLSNANVNLRVLDLLFTGKHSLGNNLSLNYNLGTARQQNNFDYTRNFANGLSVPNNFDLSFGKSLALGTDAAQVEVQSVYGTAQLGYNNYLYLDATARQDWSSTLPAPHSYFFPSVGLTAVVSEMTKMPDWISFGKVRLSYAVTGHAVEFEHLRPSYAFAQGGSNGFIFRDSRLNNPDLKPELTNSLELGMDWRFFKNRLGVDLTLYKTNTNNQELSISLPLGTGYQSKFINAGNIENRGLELQLSFTPVKSNNFSWDANLNFARNINEVIELFPDDDKKVAVISGSYGRSADVIVRPGGSVGDLIAYRWANTKVDGNYTYVEGAGERLLIDGKPVSTKVQEVIGNYNPKFTLGFGNTLNYKNFSLGFLLDGRFGGIMVSGTEANLAFYGLSDYTTLNREAWTVAGVKEGGGANDVAINAEKFWTTVSGGRYSWGEFFAYDATNVRLRELSLGYNFKLKSTDAIKGLKISLIGRNLAMLYRGSAILDIPGVPKRKMPFDPDMNLGASNWQGVDYGNMPSTRMFGVNLKLSF